MNFEALPTDEFLEEAQELLQEIEESLLLLEEDPVDQMSSKDCLGQLTL